MAETEVMEQRCMEVRNVWKEVNWVVVFVAPVEDRSYEILYLVMLSMELRVEVDARGTA